MNAAMVTLQGPAPTPATFQLLTNIEMDPAAPPPGSDNSTLSWRLSSLTSDWVLTLGHQTFNVHRCIVTEGPRHSLVFADLMQQQAHARMSHPTGGQPQATTLDNLMPAVVHSVFDNVLDFMYSGVLDPVS